MHILIIDDDAANLDLFGHMLEMLDDCAVTGLRDAREALSWCAAHAPDVVVVDYMMPGMDGLEFLRQFRMLPGKLQTPLVMVTADTQSRVRHEALRLSANDFLTKPVNFVELNARVGNLLALRRAQLELAGHAARLADEVRLATAVIAAREREAIFRLARAAEFHSPETGTHLLRMAAYAELVARNLGLDPAQCELIRTAAPLHDIGKLGVPEAILQKPGPLDERERAAMREHAGIGADILAGSDSPLLQAGAVIAASHHERWDGGGYPLGLAGAAIPLLGRIVAVADVFDALTSRRAYKQAWDADAARAAMREESGRHFDPACVDALFRDGAALAAIHQHYAQPEVLLNFAEAA
ncbi:putative two-component system response regulator [Duganella sp. 1411]|uniref:HD domain-containing phosphohydrolase n=1 Tax=Duganella sp. 1411 TaxID=2806572 RepID=UPI001AE5739B|nr:HD domain-containing phosphohydrolase [Duganella sp. 1411]MBP1206282.1 putative two-component system response regulator [Duganella sp. 1411]